MVNENFKFFWTYSVGINGLLISFLVFETSEVPRQKKQCCSTCWLF